MDNKKWRTSIVFWFVLAIFAVLTFVYNLAEVKQLASPGRFILTHSPSLASRNPDSVTYSLEPSIKGYLVKTPGCTIPDLKMMDPLIKQYIFKERSVVCNKGLPALYEANRTAISLIEESLSLYGIKNSKKLNCCFQYFRRVAPGTGQTDKRIAYDEQCHSVGSSANVEPKEEFLRIKCQYLSKEIYKDFFSFVPVVPSIESYTVYNSKEATVVPVAKSSRNQSVRNIQQIRPNLNVLVIGIDAVSRLNFHRQMPKTAFYLEKLKAVELLGYNKIGDNTYPNLIAALTGYDENEIQKTCWQKSDSYFDKCPFIWKDFKKAGFTTAFGEDASWMGLFYYTKKGFRHQPTDYYYDHFDMTATNEIGNNHRLNVDQCIGSRQSYQVFLDYISNFATAMAVAARPFFAFFWTASLSHDFLNKPKLGDQDYMNVLFNLDEEGILNSTALFILSDHGIRWGSIRSTYQGRMEERLPFLYIVLPQWYRETHPKWDRNLKINVRRLTSPFDLHETFLDLLNTTRVLPTPQNNSIPRGISLFREIPKNRTCMMAAIEQHWCTCQSSEKVNVDSSEVIQAVNYTVSHINSLLSGYADCLELRVDSIMDGRELTNDNEMKDYTKSIKDYIVTFKTDPGEAIFEATVRREEFGGNPTYSVTGTVSRINLYGEQSRCITDFHLKLYCYCRSYLG